MSPSGRRLLALALSVWTVLEGATMVHAAFVGGRPELAFQFFVTGVFTLVLGLLARYAWSSAGALSRSGVAAEPETDVHQDRRHAGLCGELDVPRRW